MIAPATDPSRAKLEGGRALIATTVMLAGHAMFKDFYVLFEREGGLPQLRITDFRDGQSHRDRVSRGRPTRPAPATTASSTRSAFRFAYQSPITSPSDLRLRPGDARAHAPASRWRCWAATTRRVTSVEVTNATARRRRAGADLDGLSQATSEAGRNATRRLLYGVRLLRLVQRGRVQLEPLQPRGPRRRLRRWPTSGAAASWARSGTTRAGCSRRRTRSPTSSPPPSTS